MGASTYQYDSECRNCGKLEYFCKCEPYPKLTEKELEEIEAELNSPQRREGDE